MTFGIYCGERQTTVALGFCQIAFRHHFVAIGPFGFKPVWLAIGTGTALAFVEPPSRRRMKRLMKP